MAGALRPLSRLLHDPRRHDDRAGRDTAIIDDLDTDAELRDLGQQRLPAGVTRGRCRSPGASATASAASPLPARSRPSSPSPPSVRADRHHRDADRRPRRAGLRRRDDDPADDGDHHPDLPGRRPREGDGPVGATSGVSMVVVRPLGGVLVDGLGWEWILRQRPGRHPRVRRWRCDWSPAPELTTTFDWSGVALSGVGMFAGSPASSRASSRTWTTPDHRDDHRPGSWCSVVVLW